MSDLTPFDHWWALYPGKRKYNKPKCREKFERRDIEVQRTIYKHTKAMIEHPGEWNDPQFVPAPEVYLNQERWEAGVPDGDTVNGRPMSTAMPDNPQQELAGLQALQKHARDPVLQGQIDELKAKMGAVEI
jgi:hypothetical protein